MQRILIATDAWHPQVNGVVRTMDSLAAQLRDRGLTVELVTPADFRTVACPSYPEIRLSLTGAPALVDRIRAFGPDAIHVATEGPIGLAARRAAQRLAMPFTTSFHTRFPEYLRERAPVPMGLTYAWLRWFHGPARACLVPTETMRRRLADRGFANLVNWTRGVDRAVFRPGVGLALDLPRPIFLTVSRVAPEKNLEAFLSLDLPGSKLVVGDGPSLSEMMRRFPEAHFAGRQTGAALASHYRAADAFVFPSKTDTFGIVLIEALACGVPVAAYPEPGPIDVLGTSAAGCISDDLREAALGALDCPRSAALERARAFSWEACADIFLAAARASADRPSPTALGLGAAVRPAA